MYRQIRRNVFDVQVVFNIKGKSQKIRSRVKKILNRRGLLQIDKRFVGKMSGPGIDELVDALEVELVGNSGSINALTVLRGNEAVIAYPGDYLTGPVSA